MIEFYFYKMSIKLSNGYSLTFNQNNGNPICSITRGSWNRTVLLSKQGSFLLQCNKWIPIPDSLITLSKEDFSTDEKFNISVIIDCLNEPENLDEDATIDNQGMYLIIGKLLEDWLNKRSVDWFPIEKNMSFNLESSTLTIDNKEYEFPSTGSEYINFDPKKFLEHSDEED